MQRPPLPPNLPRSTAAKILLAASIVLATAATLATSTCRQEHDFVTSVLPSALGDQAYHSSGAEPLTPQMIELPVGYFRGHALRAVSPHTLRLENRTVRRAGSLDGSPVAVYEHPAPDDTAPGNSDWLIKVGDDRDRTYGYFRPVFSAAGIQE